MPRLELMTWDVSAQDLPDAFERYVLGMADIYDVSGVSDEDRANFFNTSISVMSPFGAIGGGRSVRQTLSRDKALLRRSGVDGLNLLINAAALVGDADGRTVRAEPHALQIRDMGRPAASRLDSLDVLSLKIPRNLAPPALLTREMHGTAISPSVAGARLVRAHMRAIVNDLPHLSADVLDAAIQALLSLTGRVVGVESAFAPEEQASLQRTVRQSAVQYIEQRLSSGAIDIEIDTMASAIGVSRATLYRAFDAGSRGGVGRYIQDRRLHYAREALRLRTDGSRSIGEIASSYGFSSSSHFSRIFRDRYGYSPSEVQPHKPDSRVTMSDGPIRHDLLSAWLSELRSGPET